MSIFFVLVDCGVGVTDPVFGFGEVVRFLPSASLSSSEDEESAPAKSSEEESEALGAAPSWRYSANASGL